MTADKSDYATPCTKLAQAAQRLVDLLPHDLAIMWVNGRDEAACEAIDAAYDDLRALLEPSFALPDEIELRVRTPDERAARIAEAWSKWGGW